MSAASAAAVVGPSHPCTVRCGRTGTIKNGRPAFLKDNDTNHMLWFAHGADGPTWYVGKREEFGESRGWLQVKSDLTLTLSLTLTLALTQASGAHAEVLKDIDAMLAGKRDHELGSLQDDPIP